MVTTRPRSRRPSPKWEPPSTPGPAGRTVEDLDLYDCLLLATEKADAEATQLLASAPGSQAAADAELRARALRSEEFAMRISRRLRP